MSKPPFTTSTLSAGGAAKLPIPVAVIVQALQALRQQGGTRATNEEFLSHQGPSSAAVQPTSDAFVDVEVETKQGYVYVGKLIDIDAIYNLTLCEATVRRERACDVTRSFRRQQMQALRTQLGALAPRELFEGEEGEEEGTEREGALTRPRYLGSVLIRSSNLLMVRFPPPPAREKPKEGARKASGKEGSSADPRDLGRAFRCAAVVVKRATQNERRKNREDRRKRLAELKRKRESS